MMSQDSDPTEVASRWQVTQVGEEEFDLFVKNGKSSIIKVRRSGASIDIKATPRTIRWHASETSEPFYAAHFQIAEMSIGSPGDEGWSSRIANDCIFVIDGETLKHLPMNELRIVSYEQYTRVRERLAAARGVTAAIGYRENNDSRAALALATVAHCRAMPETGFGELLEFTLGLSQLHFQKLIDGCIDGRIAGAYFNGIGGALSSCQSYESARDMIICAGQEVHIHISSISLEYRL